MTLAAFALLVLSVVLAAFVPAAYRMVIALERLSAPTLSGEAPKLRDGSPAPVSPLLRLLDNPEPAPRPEDKEAIKREQYQFLMERGLPIPEDTPAGMGAEYFNRATVPQIR